MKRFGVVLGGALVAAALAVAPAFTARTAAVPNHMPGVHVDVAMFGDTIEWPATSSLGYTALNPGAANNFFAPKQAVTFRMWAVDTSNGKVLREKDVRQAFIKIPNQPIIMMKFGKLGTGATAPSYWSGTWTIPADYKLGVVDFKILLRTKAGYKLGEFTQVTLPDSSRLTVTNTP